MNKKHLLFIIILTFALAIFSYKASFALFASQATSNNNTFTAAAAFPTATPSASVTPIISPTPTLATRNLFASNGYTCSGGAETTDTLKGTVSITKTSDLTISVTLTGAIPNIAYDLWVNQDPGACPLSSLTSPSFITTDGIGNGSATLNGLTLVGSATNFWVSMVGGSDVLRSSAVSF